MSSCACRRWGSGTTCEKPVNTENSRDLESKMKQMMAERDRQSTFWTGGVCNSTNNVANTPNIVNVINTLNISNNSTKIIDPMPRNEINTSSQQQIRFWN